MGSKQGEDDIKKKQKPVSITKPLSPETAFVRTSLIPGVMRSVRWNLNSGAENLKLYEIGTVYHSREKELPREETRVACAVTGMDTFHPFYTNSKDKADLYLLKGVVENLCSFLHLDDITFRRDDHPLLSERDGAAVIYRDNVVGCIGALRPARAADLSIENEVVVCELKLSLLQEAWSDRFIFSDIPKFPSLKRDLAVVVDEDVIIGELEKEILDSGGKYITSVTLIDFFTGTQIPAGKKSVTFSLTFQSPVKTLCDKDTDVAVERIIERLTRRFSAKLRS